MWRNLKMKLLWISTQLSQWKLKLRNWGKKSRTRGKGTKKTQVHNAEEIDSCKQISAKECFS